MEKKIIFSLLGQDNNEACPSCEVFYLRLCSQMKFDRLPIQTRRHKEIFQAAHFVREQSNHRTQIENLEEGEPKMGKN